MRRLLALLQLGFNFLREVVASGWVTTRIILARSRDQHGLNGFTLLSF